MSDEERETRYLAVDGQNFDELVEETQRLLDQFSEEKKYLLTRWLSLRMAMTVVAAVKGSTQDSQAQITALLKTIQSMQEYTERFETMHVDWIGPDGKKYHPDWCRECRVSKLMHGVNRALTELERHIEGPEAPEVANVCRRVARYLTEHRDWHAPVEWEVQGLREVRALVEQYVKLDTVDDQFPWVSTIEGIKILLGDIRSMRKTIERRGRWLTEARTELANAGLRDDFRDKPPVGIPLERGAMVSIERDGVTTLYRITDVRPKDGGGMDSVDVSLQQVD